MQMTDNTTKTKTAVGREGEAGGMSENGGLGSMLERYASQEKAGFDIFFSLRLIVATVLLVCGLLLRLTGVWNPALLGASALLAGYDVLLGAIVCVWKKTLLNEKLLMTAAAIAAFALGFYYEGAAAMVLFQFGVLVRRSLTGVVQSRSARCVRELPQLVTVLRGGNPFSVGIHDVSVGEMVEVHPGETVVFDCVVLEGQSALDLSGLTGERKPVTVGPEMEICSGARNLSATLLTEVRAKADASTAVRIQEVVKAQADSPSDIQRGVQRLTKVYTPVVVGMALLLAMLLPLLLEIPFRESIHRALIFLILACPCGLMASVPLTYFVGMHGAAGRGILFRDAAAADAAAAAGMVAFHTAGTLTTGKYRVHAIKSDRMDAKTLLRIAAHAAAYSEDLVARALVEAYEGPIYIELIQAFSEQPGLGMTVQVDGVEIALGSWRFLHAQGVEIPASEELPELCAYMSVAGQYAGRIALTDTIREDAVQAVRELEEECNCGVAILSAENAAAAAKLAGQLGIDEYYGDCAPGDQVICLGLLRESAGKKHKVLFVDTGSSDGSALGAADMGVLMGGFGKDTAEKAAQVILTGDKPSGIPVMIRSARSIRSAAVQNVGVLLAIRIAALILAGCGLYFMWTAAFVDMLAVALTVFGSLRILSGPGTGRPKIGLKPFGRRKPAHRAGKSKQIPVTELEKEQK